MTAGERVFSVVRGRLYERLPALALPLGKLSCQEPCRSPALSWRYSTPPGRMPVQRAGKTEAGIGTRP